MTKINIELTTNKKEKPDPEHLVFGRTFTDHMFVMDYSYDKGWHDARIVPYGPFLIEPSAMVFHYGQSDFEGMKAFRTKEDKVVLYRPDKNMERLNLSNERLCIPPIDEDFMVEAIKQLVSIDKEWVPSAEGTSLYIRPFIIATESFIGVAPSKHFKLFVIMSPVGSYYKEGIKPVKIYVEDYYVRAVRGGTGEAKTGGNYAASLKAQEIAEQKGYSQVLWLDGVEKKYIEEVGSMNVFFKINGEVVTPALNGSILGGITRDSVIQLLKHWGIPVSERRISTDELYEAYKDGLLEESFGTGTAAVISPIGEFYFNEEKLVINNGEIGEIAKKLYDTITSIQNCTYDDVFNWVIEVK